MTIRKSADWMEQIDERILKHLQEEPSSTPSRMASIKWINNSEEKVRKRCSRLSQVELVRQIAAETFEITAIGVLYLHGEIPAEPEQRTSGHIVVHSADEDTTKGMIDAYEPAKTFRSDSDIAKTVSNIITNEVIGGLNECVVHIS